MTEFRVHIEVEVVPSTPDDNPTKLAWDYEYSPGNNPRFFGSELLNALYEAYARARIGARRYLDLGTEPDEFSEGVARGQSLQFIADVQTLLDGARDRILADIPIEDARSLRYAAKFLSEKGVKTE